MKQYKFRAVGSDFGGCLGPQRSSSGHNKIQGHTRGTQSDPGEPSSASSQRNKNLIIKTVYGRHSVPIQTDRPPRIIGPRMLVYYLHLGAGLRGFEGVVRLNKCEEIRLGGFGCRELEVVLGLGGADAAQRRRAAHHSLFQLDFVLEQLHVVFGGGVSYVARGGQGEGV